jgi:hypothetical protein
MFKKGNRKMKRLLLAATLAIAAVAPAIAQYQPQPWPETDYNVGPSQSQPLTAEEKLHFEREGLADSILYARVCPPTFQVSVEPIIQRWNTVPEEIRGQILVQQQYDFNHVGKAEWCSLMKDMFRFPVGGLSPPPRQ